MSFRATNFSVGVLLLIGATVFMIGVRNRKPLDNNWPLLYWMVVFLFTLMREEDTFNINIVLAGVAAGMLLRFEFMSPLLVRFVKLAELAVWGYVIYRGFQVILY
jgi:hypothetical protein